MGVSKDRVVRMRAIGQHLADSQYDIVCLQVRSDTTVFFIAAKFHIRKCGVQRITKQSVV